MDFLHHFYPDGTFKNRRQSGKNATGSAPIMSAVAGGIGKKSSTCSASRIGYDFIRMGISNYASTPDGGLHMGEKKKISYTIDDHDARKDSNTIEKEQEIVKKIKDDSTKTPNPNLSEDGTNTALHLAAASNNDRSVESFLIQYSNDKNFICARNSSNETALMIAIKHEYFNIIEILLKHYKKFENLLSDDEKQMIFDLAVKTNDIYLIKYLYSGALSKIEEEQHDILKKSIRNKFQKAVIHFMNSDQWQDIFRRHPSDTHSPIQLLLYYMPETAKELFDKCVKEKQQEYLSELLNDYPTNSITIKPLIDFLQSLNTEIRRKYQKLFG